MSGALSGALDVSLRGEDLTITIASLTGELNHVPFDAAGQISRIEGAWAARELDVRSGPNHAHLTLNWSGDHVEGDAKLDMPDLSKLIPDMQGDMTATVAVKGDRRTPSVDVDASSRALRYGDWSVANANVRMTSKDGRSGVGRVSVGRVSRHDQFVEQVELVARGSLDSIEVTLGWTFDAQRGSMDLLVDRVENRWNLAVAKGALIPLPGEPWRLDRRLAATFADGAFDVSAHCWLHASAGGRVCVDNAEWRDDRVRLVGTVDVLPVATLTAAFADVAVLTGTLSGRWDLASDQGHWRGDATLATNGLAIAQQGEPGSAEQIGLPKLAANIELLDDRAKVRLLAIRDAEQVLSLDMNIVGLDSTASLDGHATVAAKDLGFLATFSRRIGELNGALAGEFDIGGTIADPKLTGSLKTVDVRVVLTEPRVELTSVDLSLQIGNPRVWNVRGTARSDKGRVDLTGELIDPLQDTRRFHARIDATDLPAQLPDVDVRMAGSVELNWSPDLFAVKGRIEIPRATITLSELPPGAVAVSDDVIVVNRVAQHPNGWRLQADLEIVLKDNVQFSAFGLTTHLTGTLRLRQSLDGVIQLNGTLLLVDGTFKAFGQTLAIDSGRLTYSGPPQEPYVDASASRTIQEATRTVKVGARIQGPASAIETTLTSDPAMSEAEALAYLVLGRPLSGATAQEGNDVMGAAIALGLKGAAPVIKEVSNALGLEELTATGGSAEDLTVVAGKRFSNRIFVRYSYQTFTRMSAILIELMLSRRLALEATASDIPAIDLIYKVGRDN